MIIVKIIYSIIFIWFWALLLKYRRQIKKWSWGFAWAEKALGRWGTYFVIILVWLISIFFWFIYPFWWIDLLLWDKNVKVNLK